MPALKYQDALAGLSSQAVDPIEAVVLVPTGQANTPQPLSTTDVFFKKGWFYAYKAVPSTGGAPTNNGGNVYVGKSATAQPDLLVPGDAISYIAEGKESFNLATIYFNGAVGDGLFYSVS